jgi:hypothetical protein
LILLLIPVWDSLLEKIRSKIEITSRSCRMRARVAIHSIYG